MNFERDLEIETIRRHIQAMSPEEAENFCITTYCMWLEAQKELRKSDRRFFNPIPSKTPVVALLAVVPKYADGTPVFEPFTDDELRVLELIEVHRQLSFCPIAYSELAKNFGRTFPDLIAGLHYKGAIEFDAYGDLSVPPAIKFDVVEEGWRSQ